MQIRKKTFTLEGLTNLTADFIENFIETMGFKPLRWAVVKIKEDKFTVESVIVK